MLATDHDVYNKADLEFGTNIAYYRLPDSESWRVSLVKDILSIKSDELIVENLRNEELDMILEIACSN